MFQSYIEPPYAGFWIRFAAYLIDNLILSVVSCPLGFGIGLIGAAVEVDPNSPEWAGINVLLNGVVVLASWLYFALMESSSWQGTVGKKLLKLKVVDTDGSPIGFGKASGRYFGKILSSLICLIGFIMAAFTEKRQGLHDMLASTLVVYDVPPLYEPPPPPPDFNYRPSDAPGGNY
jgi:uncharacterized RDD family membrane protein YckC